MERMKKCPFCGPAAEEVVIQGRLWYGRWDRYLVSPGHLLLIPLRHVADLFEATEEEMTELPGLLNEAKALLDLQFHPDGFNVGVNCGKAAGQTVMHLHVRLIPRGGVRGVIPERRVS